MFLIKISGCLIFEVETQNKINRKIAFFSEFVFVKKNLRKNNVYSPQKKRNFCRYEVKLTLEGKHTVLNIAG